MRRKVLVALFVVFCVSFVWMQGTKVEASTTGNIGDNISWVLDDDGTLTLSGNGEMKGTWTNPAGYPFTSYKESIKKVVISEGIENIYTNTFNGLDSLKEVIIPNSVKKIGAYAFYNCPSIEKITMPAKVEIITEYDFGTMNSLKYVLLTGTGEMQDYHTMSDNQTAYTVYYKYTPWYKASANGREIVVELEEGITSVGVRAFEGCENLTEVIIPSTVIKFGESAFYNCKKLKTEISIPAGTKFIENWTFYNCESLTGDFVIPNSVEEIGQGAFSGCKGINKITLPATAKIQSGAFQTMNSLREIVLTGKGEMQNYINSSSDTYSSNYQWTPWYSASSQIKNSGMTANIEVEIKEGITSIGDYAFCDCENITVMSIPESVKSIGKYAFNNCKKMSGNVVIPSGMTEIGDYTFNNCESLKELVIPDSIKKIGNHAFYNCSRIEKIVMPATTLLKDDAFNNMRSLKSVKLTGKGSMITFSNSYSRPVNVSYYDDSPWYSSSSCENEVEVEISSGITSISDFAFNNCRYLSKLVIPDTVEEIGKNAFVNNDLLSSIEYGGNEKAWKNISIGENNNLDSIKIAYNSKQSKSDSSSGEAKLNVSKKSMTVGEKFELSLENVSGKTTWKSSNTKVITVDNGTVTAVGSGTATVTATNNGTKYKCKITVEGAAGLNHTTATLNVGESLKLKVSGTKAVSFTSSKKSVAKVKASGTVVAKKAGTTTIKVKCENGQTYTCKVTVKK